ncbi:DNA-directed RNA polymerase sigma-70 factor [Dyadobacter endophyticus]|uniref:DNA-directed RNA polymerase sigma-70 factor n=1 Tax=Dyadobacter endophyticus TaxID=1749036 RepID=A0ABQ1YF14_9BACT|nr:sigma-70 family RNA polymerase sigma factor [Dyadobacter endophyticus]GGH22188.1 DNA-directed RNA polymerase sigma-70 factor [Dyadobacter endophyticus]
MGNFERIIDDSELWLDYRNGDNEALGLLADRYYGALRRYGMKFLVDESIVEDCIQDLFLDLWQNRERISQTPSVKFYLFKAIRHSILGHMRYQQRFANEESQDWDSAMPENFNAESLLIEQETLNSLVAQMHAQMEALPKREREALFLRYYENMSVADISGVMGVNRQSVSNFLQKGITRIRAKWFVTTVFNLCFF